MPRTLLLVGTRKGCFVLESDADRRDWDAARPLLRGLAGVPRRPRRGDGHDLRRRRERVARLGDLAQPRPRGDVDAVERGHRLRRGRRAQGVEGLDAGRQERAACSSASRRRGSSRAATGARRWSLLSTLAGPARQRALGRPGEPAARPPRHLRAHVRHRRRRRASGRSSRASACSRPRDDGESWTPRNRGLRADWPRPHEEVGFCVHKLVRSPVDGDRMYQQNHVGMHRCDDAGHSWTEITDGLPTEFGFAAATHPHDRDTFYVIPLDPGTARTCPTGTRPSGGRATRARAGSASIAACPQRGRATSACSARAMAIDALRRARPLLRHEHRPGLRERRRGRELERDRRATCRRSRRSRSRSSTDGRRPSPSDAAAALPRAAAARRRRRRHGRRRDRPARRAVARASATACASPGPLLRPHIHVYVDRERAALDTPLDDGARGVDVIAAISGG